MRYYVLLSPYSMRMWRGAGLHKKPPGLRSEPGLLTAPKSQLRPGHRAERGHPRSPPVRLCQEGRPLPPAALGRGELEHSITPPARLRLAGRRARNRQHGGPLTRRQGQTTGQATGCREACAARRRPARSVPRSHAHAHAAEALGGEDPPGRGCESGTAHFPGKPKSEIMF